MKKLITPAVVYTPGSQTLDTGIPNFDIRRLYAIINQTRGEIIYATSLPGKGYTAVSGSQLSLQANTSTHQATDVLQIIYEDSEDIDLTTAIYELLDRLAFLPSVRGINADLRVSLMGGTVSNLSNISQIGGYNVQQHMPATQNVAAMANINNVIIS